MQLGLQKLYLSLVILIGHTIIFDDFDVFVFWGTFGKDINLNFVHFDHFTQILVFLFKPFVLDPQKIQHIFIPFSVLLLNDHCII